MAFDELRKAMLQSRVDIPDPLISAAQANADAYARELAAAHAGYQGLVGQQEQQRRALALSGMKNADRNARRDRKYGMLAALLGGGASIGAGQMKPAAVAAPAAPAQTPYWDTLGSQW